MTRRWALLLATFLTASLLAGCSDGAPGVAAATGSNALTAFADCDEFAARMNELTRDHASANGYTGTSGPADMPVTSDVRAAVRSATPPNPAPDGAAASAFETPDLLKTDGDLVVAKSDRKFWVYDFSGDRPVQRGSLALPGGPFLLLGDRALVVTPTFDSFNDIDLNEQMDEPKDQVTRHVVLKLVDLKDPDHPEVLQSEVISGELVSASAQGGVARIVVSSDPRRIRANAPGGGWLPTRQIRSAGGEPTATGPLLDCTDIRRPPEDAGPSILSVLTIDAARDDAFAAAETTGILAGGDLVTASATRLLVATTGGWGAPQEIPGPRGTSTPLPAPVDPRTRIHAFDISGPATTYLGSGTVANYLDGPASMSPREGILRVVTTTVPPWWFERENRQVLDSHAVLVLSERAGALVQTAATQIAVADQSLGVVRWFDDLLAVASRPSGPRFDDLVHDTSNNGSGPLHLVDLSDPGAPRDGADLAVGDGLAGLQPIGNGRLATIGTQVHHATAAASGSTNPEFATWDVSDPRAPRRIDGISLAEGGLYQDHALAWPQRRLVVGLGWARLDLSCAADQRCAPVPAATCRQAGGCGQQMGDPQFRGAVALTVDADGRLTPSAWFAGHRGFFRILRVGDRLAAMSIVGVTMLDPDLHPRGTLGFRKASQP